MTGETVKTTATTTTNGTQVTHRRSFIFFYTYIYFIRVCLVEEAPSHGMGIGIRVAKTLQIPKVS